MTLRGLIEAVAKGLPYFAHLGWCNSKGGRDCNCGHDQAYAAILRALDADQREGGRDG